MECTKTLKLRVKDKHAKVLCQMAREVNQVWNYVNELSCKAIQPYQGSSKFLSGYDLQRFTVGFSKCEGVSVASSTVDLVCVEYATRRKQFKRTKLNWRVSNSKSSKKSLGWVPFKSVQIRYKSGQIYFAGQKLCLWDSYGLNDYELRSGSFNEDSRGRWYFNVVVKVQGKPSEGSTSIGVDLGLKECATTSAGDTLQGRWYRNNEKDLGIAQKARNKKRVRSIHAKIKNQRKDALHKFSSDLVKNNAAIFVGDVSSAKLIKTKMAKSTLDAGWSMMKTMLEYKSHQAGVVFEIVTESYTTQTCSCCGVIPTSSPKGRASLRIREWVCSSCTTVHDRDVNAAKNILAAGHRRLVEGIAAL